MTEHSSFLEIPEASTQSGNGHVSGEETLPRVDPIRGVFITSRQQHIELSGKPISSLMLERLTNEGRPRIPLVEVTLMGKHKQLEPHPEDPGYKALLEEWTQDSRMKTMRYVFIMGVKGTPPPEFIEEQRSFFPNASDGEMKYLWVASRVPDDDIDAFINAVIGRSIPTTKGLEDSADSFRSED